MEAKTKEKPPSTVKKMRSLELTPDILLLGNPEEVCRQIEGFIIEKMTELDKDGVILGLSGGLDSVAVAFLCANSVGSDKVLALYMPDKDSDPKHGNHAQQIATKLGIRFEIIDITQILQAQGTYKHLPRGFGFSKRLTAGALKSYFRIAKILGQDRFSDSLGGASSAFVRKGDVYAKSKHRIRMCKLYERAGIENFLVVGAANLTETEIGFFAKWGIDHATDIMPIGCLYKTQVRQLAKCLEVPQKIIEKAPSPDLIPGFTDEGIVGPYSTIDVILSGMKRRLSVTEISTQSGIPEKKVRQVWSWTEKSAHMRDSPYVPTIRR